MKNIIMRNFPGTKYKFGTDPVVESLSACLESEFREEQI